jgi:hypothetical protein
MHSHKHVALFKWGRGEPATHVFEQTTPELDEPESESEWLEPSLSLSSFLAFFLAAAAKAALAAAFGSGVTTIGGFFAIVFTTTMASFCFFSASYKVSSEN